MAKQYMGPVGVTKLLTLIHEKLKGKQDILNEITEAETAAMWEDLKDPTPRITVSVDIAGEPVYQAGIQIVDEATSTPIDLGTNNQTDEEGYFTFKGVEAGKAYTVMYTTTDGSGELNGVTIPTGSTRADVVFVNGSGTVTYA